MKRTNDIENFNRWFEVEDYNSDEFTVDLLDSKGKIIGKFYYIGFTQEDFDKLSNKK